MCIQLFQATSHPNRSDYHQEERPIHTCSDMRKKNAAIWGVNCNSYHKIMGISKKIKCQIELSHDPAIKI